MFLPPQYAWFGPVVIASLVVFVFDLVGTSMTFNNHHISALMSALVSTVVFSGLSYSGLGSVSMSIKAPTSFPFPSKSDVLWIAQKAHSRIVKNGHHHC